MLKKISYYLGLLSFILPSAAMLQGIIPISAFANSSTVSVSISSPGDGETIDAKTATVTGLASAIGGGEGVDIMLVLDDSDSLTVTDPTKERFDAVKQLLNSLNSDANIYMGLIFFAGSAEVANPLASIGSVKPSIMNTLQSKAEPFNGTNIAAGIRAASSQLDNGRANASKIILLFTDALDTSSDAVLAAQEAVNKGQVVHVVGLFAQDPRGEELAKAITQSGQGQMFLANNPGELGSLFSGTSIVGIQSITVANLTTGQTAQNVAFAAGSYTAPVGIGEGENTLEVTAVSTTGASNTASVTVNVPVDVPVQVPFVKTYTVKARPQVIMAGFDPMLLNIGDDEFKLMAVVREGSLPIRHVRISENTGPLGQGYAMTREGQLPNGDKVYSFSFISTPLLPSMNDVLSNLFGSQPGEYNITVIDEGGLEHSFPKLEFGVNRDVQRELPISQDDTYTVPGVHRARPQTLLVGFDPAMLHLSDDAFKVKAIVRRGSTPIRHVSLQMNNSTLFSMKMDKEMDLPNGDEMYSLTYIFQPGDFPSSVFEDLFGTASQTEFVVKTTDEGGFEHRFPEFNVCNCREIQVQ